MPLHHRRPACLPIENSKDKISVQEQNDKQAASSLKWSIKRLTPFLNKQQRCHFAHFKLLLVFIVGLPIMFLLVRFAQYEYAWVYQRCLVASLLRTSVRRRIVCEEAWAHMVANYDTALLWTPDLLPNLSQPQIQTIQMEEKRVRERLAAGANPPVTNVHYTLTAPFSNSTVSSLGKCSVETMTRLCQDARCRLNIWVVDRAAQAISDVPIQSYLRDLVGLIQSVDGIDKVPYCIRIIQNPSSYEDQDEDDEHRIKSLSSLLNTSVSALTGHHCPQPTRRSKIAGMHMREWLGSDAARQHQIPEHTSDAWRLVTLLEWGGLYLDMDVIPLSSLLLQIPRNSVPVQRRIGGYRMNGGVLRLGDGESYDKIFEFGSVDRYNESFLLRRPNRKPTFLETIEKDHLHWAPILARLPVSEQTFGFLGPGALTRVFVSHDSYEGNVTVLPGEVIEPTIDESLCKGVESKRSLAAHFSGKRKKSWLSTIKKYKCLEAIFQGSCPLTPANLIVD